MLLTKKQIKILEAYAALDREGKAVSNTALAKATGFKPAGVKIIVGQMKARGLFDKVQTPVDFKVPASESMPMYSFDGVNTEKISDLQEKRAMVQEAIQGGMHGQATGHFPAPDVTKTLKEGLLEELTKARLKVRSFEAAIIALDS